MRTVRSKQGRNSDWDHAGASASLGSCKCEAGGQESNTNMLLLESPIGSKRAFIVFLLGAHTVPMGSSWTPDVLVGWTRLGRDISLTGCLVILWTLPDPDTEWDTLTNH